MIRFLGTSFAAKHLEDAAKKRGLPVTDDLHKADLVFVSHDTPTDETGKRDLLPIRRWLHVAVERSSAPIVLTSQVPPGFTRSLGIERIWYQAETLRIKDAKERAMNPEQIIVGGPSPIPPAYAHYLAAFNCPILRMSWESAEFAKIAINIFLAAQVDTTNRLAAAAKKVGASWQDIAGVLMLDKRIGKYAYLAPGRWQDSLHLLRDAVTL